MICQMIIFFCESKKNNYLCSRVLIYYGIMAKNNKFSVGEELWILDNDNVVRKYCVDEIETRSSGGSPEIVYYHFQLEDGTDVRREESLCFKSPEGLKNHINEMIDLVE